MSDIDIHQYTRAMLEAYDFPGTDAAVLFVPQGQSPSGDVQAVLDRSGQQRWYPVEGGHNVKVPWHHAEGHESLFEREAKGWDHEHCDFCNASVSVGERCWTTESENGFWLFCGQCRDSLRDA
jgi:hypothetical protein